MFNPHQGECIDCHNVKMVESIWINGGMKELCADCTRNATEQEYREYQAYLAGIADPRD